MASDLKSRKFAIVPVYMFNDRLQPESAPPSSRTRVRPCAFRGYRYPGEMSTPGNHVLHCRQMLADSVGVETLENNFLGGRTERNEVVDFAMVINSAIGDMHGVVECSEPPATIDPCALVGGRVFGCSCVCVCWELLPRVPVLVGSHPSISATTLARFAAVAGAAAQAMTTVVGRDGMQN